MGCFQLKSDLCVLKIYLMVFFLKLKILPPYNNIINVKKKKAYLTQVWYECSMKGKSSDSLNKDIVLRWGRGGSGEGGELYLPLFFFFCLCLLSKSTPPLHFTGKEQFERKLSEFIAKRKL